MLASPRTWSWIVLLAGAIAPGVVFGWPEALIYLAVALGTAALGYLIVFVLRRGKRQASSQG